MLGIPHPRALSLGKGQIAQPQPRSHGLGQPGQVDHPLRRQGRQGRRGTLVQQPVDVLLHDHGVPFPGDRHQGQAPFQTHGDGGRIVQGRRTHRQTDTAPTGAFEGAGQDPFRIHGQGVQAALPMAGGRLESGVDQGFAGHLLGIRKQGNGGVHGVLGAGADQDILGRHPHRPAPEPARNPGQMRQGVAGAGVVQQPRRGCAVQLSQAGGQIQVLGRHRRNIGTEVDDPAQGLVLGGEQSRLRGHPQDVGAPAHFPAQVAPAGGLPVGATDGADVHPDQVGQQPVGGQLVAGPEQPQPNGIAHGIGDGQIGGLPGDGELRYPDAHAYNHVLLAHKFKDGKGSSVMFQGWTCQAGRVLPIV